MKRNLKDGTLGDSPGGFWYNGVRFIDRETLMNTKRFALLSAALLLCAIGASASQALHAGEAAIYKIGGFLTVDRINDISITRHVLETANNGNIPLQNIWMINFVDDKWNFPGERKQITTNDHYVFMKNGAISSGRIVDFSSARRWFEFENGQKFPIGEIRRIYFSKALPPGLAAQLEKEKEEKPVPIPPPATFVGEYEQLNSEQVYLLRLKEDKTAEMVVPRFPSASIFIRDLNKTLVGVWEATGDNQVTLKFAPSEVNRLSFVYVFNREENVLIATGDARETYGDLRLTRR